ncbi:MAG: hypothetical protein ACRELE_08385 [Gemmatimonadales bacterium]
MPSGSQWSTRAVATSLFQRRRLATITCGVIIVVAAALWFNRGRLGLTAVTIADPLVRAWAARQVLESSDSVYHLTASTIRVDEANRRVVIDTITLTTDTVANARLSRPHPALAVRFSRCGLTGIDLRKLTAGSGLHALHGGCDSVSLAERTLVAPIDNGVTSTQVADSNNFLRFQRQINLPRVLPFVEVDAVDFPHIHVAFDLLGSDGRRTALAVDSLAASLDSVRIDPRQPVAKRRPLFSRDINVRLDRFEGSTKDAVHISLQHLRANLEDGTCRLEALVFEPSREGADSLGLTDLRAQRLMLAGVNWRSFLLTGSVAVGRFTVDTLLVRVLASTHQRSRVVNALAVARHLETALRAVGRTVRLDSLALSAITIVEAPVRRADSIVTTIRRVDLAHLAFGPDEASWNSAFPIGRVTLAVSSVLRRTKKMNIAVSHLALDAAARRIVADTVRAAPAGNDAAFQRRTRYRKSRLSVAMARAESDGIDLPAYLRRGALRARTLDVRGLHVDVMKDKSKPEDPAPNVIRRTPQGVMRSAAAEIQVDTLTATGMVSYRERDSTAATAGTLTFGALQLRGYNFSTDPLGMTGATPFVLVGDTKLMGVGAMHVEWTVPLLSRDFAMHWRGSLGPMDPKAMNAFLPNAVGMRFIGGSFDGARWDVTVRNGVATGKLVPRWHDLRVELPGVARNDSGVVGGLIRGFAKLAANAFGIHGDNDSTGGHRPRDASITHQWVNTETLPQFIWFQLRDPLMLLLKK